MRAKNKNRVIVKLDVKTALQVERALNRDAPKKAKV